MTEAHSPPASAAGRDDEDVVLMPFVGRSGSTWLGNALSRHPLICVCPEAEALPRLLWQLGPGEVATARDRLASALQQAMQSDDKLSGWQLDPSRLLSPTGLPALYRENASGAEVMFDVLRAYRDQVVPDATRIFYKCNHTLLLQRERGAGWRPLPAAAAGVRWLGILRDGRACYASQRRAIRPRTGRPMQVSPVNAAHNWRRYVEALEVLGRAVERLHLVAYEPMMRDSGSVLEQTRRWLEVPAIEAAHREQASAPASAALEARIPEAQRHLHTNLSRAPQASRIDHWRRDLSPLEIALFERHAGDALARHGYALEAPNLSPLHLTAGSALFAMRARWHGLAIRADKALGLRRPPAAG